MKNKDFEVSSGNLFADLEVPNPEERLAKVKLAVQINHLIDSKGLNQKDAALLLGIDQPKISALSKGKLAGFSFERLFRFLNILGQGIIIEVMPKTQTKKKPAKPAISAKVRNVPSTSKLDPIVTTKKTI